MSVKKAVIVAAGLSSRLYPRTLKEPKGLLQINGVGLLQRSIKILKNNGITEIALVVGFEKEQIMQQLGNSVTYITNPFFKNCNNMGSLWFAKDFVSNDPFVYLHGDIIYSEKLFQNSLNNFLKNGNDIELVTDYSYSDKESMKVRCVKDKFLIESNKEIDLKKSDGEWIGIAFVKSSKKLFAKIEEILFNEGLNFYDTHAFTQLAQKNCRIFCSPTDGEPWVEIDFEDDYQRAKKLFESST
jgi:choline kinase